MFWRARSVTATGLPSPSRVMPLRRSANSHSRTTAPGAERLPDFPEIVAQRDCDRLLAHVPQAVVPGGAAVEDAAVELQLRALGRGGGGPGQVHAQGHLLRAQAAPLAQARVHGGSALGLAGQDGRVGRKQPRRDGRSEGDAQVAQLDGAGDGLPLAVEGLDVDAQAGHAPEVEAFFGETQGDGDVDRGLAAQVEPALAGRRAIDDGGVWQVQPPSAQVDGEEAGPMRAGPVASAVAHEGGRHPQLGLHVGAVVPGDAGDRGTAQVEEHLARLARLPRQAAAKPHRQGAPVGARGNETLHAAAHPRAGAGEVDAVHIAGVFGQRRSNRRRGLGGEEVEKEEGERCHGHILERAATKLGPRFSGWRVRVLVRGRGACSGPWAAGARRGPAANCLPSPAVCRGRG